MSSASSLLDSVNRYGLVSRIFHWSMAVLFILQFGIAITLSLSGEGAVSDALWPLHQQVGFTLFLLAFLRGAWGILNLGRRHHAPGLSGRLAAAGHLVIYALMLLVPLLALMRAAGDQYGFSFLGVEIFTPAAAENTALTAPGNAAHSLLGWVLLAAIAGHVAMAMLHHFMLGDDTLRRMIGQESKG
ncbi:cytochrome b [Ochrobactrum sp. BD67]